MLDSLKSRNTSLGKVMKIWAKTLLFCILMKANTAIIYKPYEGLDVLDELNA